MSHFQTERVVKASQQRTFDAYTDLENAATNIRSIERLEILGGTPVGVGTRFRETRLIFKKETTEEMEVSALESPHVIVISGDSCGALFTTEFRFEPKGPHTRLNVRITVKPVSLIAKLMSPISGLMMKSFMKQFEADLDDMAAVAEGRSPALAGTDG